MEVLKKFCVLLVVFIVFVLIVCSEEVVLLEENIVFLFILSGILVFVNEGVIVEVFFIFFDSYFLVEDLIIIIDDLILFGDVFIDKENMVVCYVVLWICEGDGFIENFNFIVKDF